MVRRKKVSENRIMENPLISVCIPVYNCEDYIKFAIDSVLGQTFREFELIVIDNFSTDRTLAIARQYADKRLRIIENKKNIGAEGNWNLALSEAKGEYIKLLCADDMLYPECLEKQYRILASEQNKDIVLVSSLRNVIDEKNHILMKRGFKSHGKISGMKAIKKNIRSGANLIGEPSAVLMRKSVLNRTGGFSGTIPYVIDLDLWVRMLLWGNLFVVIEPLCCFRISRGSWSVAIRKRQQKDFINFITKLRNDKAYGITLFDYGLGRLNAALNAIKRKILYRIIQYWPDFN